MLSSISEARLAAFYDELCKESSVISRGGEMAGDFLKRQWHALTGWTPHGFHNVTGIEQIGAGAADARHGLEKAREVIREAAGQKARAAATKKLEKAKKVLEVNEEAQRMGLTSLPGYIKSLHTHGIKPTLRAGFNQQWHGTGPFEKTIMVGLPAAATAMSTLGPEDPENPHKARAVMGNLAETAAGMATGNLPLAGALAVGAGANMVGRTAGGLVDRFRKKKIPAVHGALQAPPAPEEAPGQHVPIERYMSPAAAGQTPEVFG